MPPSFLEENSHKYRSLIPVVGLQGSMVQLNFTSHSDSPDSVVKFLTIHKYLTIQQYLKQQQQKQSTLNYIESDNKKEEL